MKPLQRNMAIDAGGVWSVDGDEGHPPGAEPFLVASLTEMMCPLQKGYYAGRHSDQSKVNARLELLTRAELTELRAINFSMEPIGRQLPLSEVRVRRSGRLAAVVSVPPPPLPKRYTMHATNDNEIRAACW